MQAFTGDGAGGLLTSMKALPRRKGNILLLPQGNSVRNLNESPSEKEGKSTTLTWTTRSCLPSMKVPPKRKGNVGA